MNATTRFQSLDLSSRFQPIFGVSERRAIGYEALLTASDLEGSPVSPAALFARANATGETVYLDWMARALHLRNFHTIDPDETRLLFMNVAPKTALEDLRYPSVFAAVMETFEIDPHRVVVEILEDPVEDEARLGEAVAYYRAFGCSIALDDFDGGVHCGERLARLLPDVVKVARPLVNAAGLDPDARRLLNDTVATIHAFGATVVLEGVETRVEAQVAMDSGAECVQGYYFALPATRGADEMLAAQRFADLAVNSGTTPRRAPRRAPWPARPGGMAS